MVNFDPPEGRVGGKPPRFFFSRKIDLLKKKIVQIRPLGQKLQLFEIFCLSAKHLGRLG